MSTAPNSTPSRKPSSSSSPSVGNPSPSGSPNPAAHNRTLTPASASNVYGGMGPASGLKINNGWKYWSNSATAPATPPASKRTTSMSSSASMSEVPQSHTPWAAMQQGSSWDVGNTSATSTEWEIDGSPKKKGANHQELQANSSYSFQHARQRQAAAAQAAAFSAPHKREDPAARRVVSESEARHGLKSMDDSGAKMTPAKLSSQYATVAGPYTAQHSLLPITNHLNSHLEGATTRPSIDDASISLRGAEDGAPANSPHKPFVPPNQGPQASGPRGPPPLQHRAPYNGYLQQPDYTQYYNGAVAPEGYTDYSFGYDQYRGAAADPSMYTASNAGPMSPYLAHRSHPAEMHRPPNNVYYPEFNNVGAGHPPGTQFYYPSPHQPMLFHPQQSPMPSPMIPPAASNALADKKRDHTNMPYGFQPQQLPLQHQQNMLMPRLRHVSVPGHPQYPDYGGGMPAIIPGQQMFQQNLRGPRGLHPHGYQPHGRDSRQRRNGQTVETGPELRSACLAEFRTNKSRKWELKDIAGYIVEFSGDQHGSRFIQQKLETASSEDKQAVFDEILPDSILPLICDVFGNYVIQKLFEHGTQLQKTILSRSMDGHVLTLSLQMYGCRVVQKAIEFVLPEQQTAMIKELEGQILKCVKDANGNHVVQKLVERVSAERLPFISSFRGSVYELATHPYGCRVLQRCFEYLGEPQTRPLFEEMLKFTLNLAQDQFGNYVIQFVLENGSVDDRTALIAKLKGQLLSMSKHKFASNVCEKALVTANDVDRRDLIDEIMTLKPDGTNPIAVMMKDQFANYVLQRALNVVDESQAEELINKIRPQLANIRRFSSAYSKHLNSIERLMAEKVATMVVSQPPLSSDPSAIPEVTVTSDPSTQSLSQLSQIQSQSHS